MLGEKIEIRSTKPQINSKDGNKGEREDGGRGSMLRGEKLCVDHHCGIASGGGFFLEFLSFEFVGDFEFGISNFRIGCGQRPR
jgi:hypothetical protein